MGLWSWITGGAGGADGARASVGATAHPRDPVIAEIWGMNNYTSAGARVTPDTAMRVGAVYAAVRVLSETVAMLPLILYRRLDAGGKERARAHPLFSLLHDRPNRWQNAFEWREMMTAHVVLRGNAYSEIIGAGGRGVAELVPLHPDRMRAVRLDDGALVYEHQPLKGARRVLLASEVFHLRALSMDGIVGLNPIAHHRESIGMAIAAEEYASRFWANDASPRGVLKMPNHFRSADDAKAFRDQWQKAQTGANRHKVAVLEDGLEFQQIGISARDAQFIESRKFQVTDIARLFRVPPHMIGDLERATFSNIEHQAIGFVTHTMAPWFRRWESAIGAQLMSEADRETYFAEFLVDALLRGDTKTRFEAYNKAVMTGWLNRNEVREIENRNPVEGLDEFLTPMNMAAGSDPEPGIGDEGTGGGGGVAGTGDGSTKEDGDDT
ncbi:MAG: phage portal protein [Alphaproteobacteria bacterium]